MSSQRKVALVLGLILMAAVLVWAASELSGQINQMAQDTGSITAEAETISLEFIRPSVGAAGGDQESKLRKSIVDRDGAYQKVMAKAQKEMKEQGQVSAATSAEAQSSASAFKIACDQYSAFWRGASQTTRADLAAAVGVSRLAGAAVVAGGMNADTQKALRDSLKKLGQARAEYVREVVEKKDMTDADRENLHATLSPRAKALVNQAQEFANRVTSLLTQLQSRKGGGGSSRCEGPQPKANPIPPELQRDWDNARELDRTGREALSTAQRILDEEIALHTFSIGTILVSSRLYPCFIENE
jgi:hypothetical protein